MKGRNPNRKMPDECCLHCRSYSSAPYNRHKGFCLKRKVSVKGSDVCAYFTANRGGRYVMTI